MKFKYCFNLSGVSLVSNSILIYRLNLSYGSKVWLKDTRILALNLWSKPNRSLKDVQRPITLKLSFPYPMMRIRQNFGQPSAIANMLPRARLSFGQLRVFQAAKNIWWRPVLACQVSSLSWWRVNRPFKSNLKFHTLPLVEFR